MKNGRQHTLVRLFAVVFSAISSSAHEGIWGEAEPRNFHELARAWEFDPLVIIGLVLSGWLYFRGLRRLWQATKPGNGIRAWEASSYAAGWLAIVIALVSPLHPWGRVLFSAHMTQHEVLMLVAAPLLVLGKPLIAFLWAFHHETARKISGWTKARWWQLIWKILSNAFAAWLIHAIILWAWHIPSLFEATIRNDFVHALQHFSFLFSALLFWWAVLHGRQKSIGYGMAVLYMFSTALHSGLLGALLTFTNSVWYPVYNRTAPFWGLTPIEDQQLGGLIMWVPAGIVYIIAGLALFAGWMRESEKRARKAEAHFPAAVLQDRL
jgi:putative membrane protein